jgi:hypothetical protein
MRCHEARRRLLGASDRPVEHDKELLEHLRHCRECYLFAQAELALGRDLLAAAVDDNVDTVPLAALRARVEARAKPAAVNLIKEISLMSRIKGQIKNRPRLGIITALTIVILAFATLVPFKIQETVAYEVAIAGVDENLAVDEEKVDQLLTVLELDDAKFSVEGCEAKKCVIKISDLGSEDDVQVVTTAFDEMGDCKVSYVKPVTGEIKTTLVDAAKKKVFYVGGVVEKSDREDYEIQTFVTSCIEMLVDGDSINTFNIWITNDSVDICTVKLDSAKGMFFIGNDSADCKTVGVDIVSSMECDSKQATYIVTSTCNLNDMMTIKLEKSDDQENMFLMDTDGELIEIDLEDENLEEVLREHGIKAKIIRDEAGNIIEIRLFDAPTDETDEGSSLDEEPETDLEKKAAALPEGYDLGQNHPNPFNPDTEIAYSIPETQHVSLDIFNIQGQKVRSLVDEVQSSGRHIAKWDATNDNGEMVSSGVYLYRFASGNVIAKKKMTLLK